MIDVQALNASLETLSADLDTLRFLHEHLLVCPISPASLKTLRERIASIDDEIDHLRCWLEQNEKKPAETT